MHELWRNWRDESEEATSFGFRAYLEGTAPRLAACVGLSVSWGLCACASRNEPLLAVRPCAAGVAQEGSSGIAQKRQWLADP